MQAPTVKQIEWSRPEPNATDAVLLNANRTRLAGWCGIFGITMFVALLLAPLFESVLLFGLYHHWGAALTERANARPGVLAALVPAAVAAVLLVRSANHRSIVKPWTWLRPCILLFFISLTAVESAKLALGNEPVFGPKGETRQYYVVRSDGTVVITDHAGIDNSGRPFQPITPDNVDWITRMKSAGPRLPQKADPAKSPWFLPGGQAVLFCVERNGKLEFFDRPGKHPETREELREVTPEIRAKWEASCRQEAIVKELEDKLKTTKLRMQKLEEDHEALTEKATALEMENQKPTQPVLQQPDLVERHDSILQERPASIRPQPTVPPVIREQPTDTTSAERTVGFVRSMPKITNTPTMPLSPPPREFSCPPLAPRHLDCGTRHWRGEWCPRYGFPRPPPPPVMYPPVRYYSYPPPMRCRPRVYIRVCR